MTDNFPPTHNSDFASPGGSGQRSKSGVRYIPIAVFGALGVLLLVSLLRPGDPSLIPSVLIGKQAPRLTLPPLDGIYDNGAPIPGITPADLARGGPVIVNFWQSSCAPCVAEHPLLIMLRDKTGVPLVGINTKDPVTGARRFLNRFGIPFTNVGIDADGRAAIEWGVYGMPETFIVDGKGMVVAKHIGAITEDVIVNELIPALERAR
jgi:cytochrome c biogenesis protein CcmG, thiol:disulfide interchange protein DsbE